MAAVAELEHLGEPPEEAVFCLLCRGTIALPDEDTSKYERHLRQEHGVFYNRQWLVAQTLASQINCKGSANDLDFQTKDESLAAECNGSCEKLGEAAIFERITDKPDEEKGKVTSPRRRESHTRNRELSATSLQRVKEDILKSEASSKKERLSISNTKRKKESQENDEREEEKQSGKNPVKTDEESLGKENGAEKVDERYDSKSATHSTEIPEVLDDIPKKIFFPQPSKDIISVNRKMKEVRVVLTSKDTVRGVTEQADVDQKEEMLRENSNEAEATDVVWAECNEELSNLVNQISEKIDTEVDKDGDDETCAKEESEDTSVSQEVAKIEEPEEIEFNPKWIKDAVRGGQTCYVHIKNESYSTFFGDELLEKVKKATKISLRDHPQEKEKPASLEKNITTVGDKEGTSKQRKCTLREEKGESKEEDSLQTNDKEMGGDGELAKPKGKRKRSADSEEEIIHPRRKRGAVKYNCDSSDEESDKDNETKHLDLQVTKPRESASSSSGGEVESWSSKVFSNDYKDSCQVACEECNKTMAVTMLRMHTRKKHDMDISAYKRKHGSRYSYVVTTYHKCQLCEQEILLDRDSLASHCRSRHGMSLKDFNIQYMINGDGNEDDENEPSTSKSSVSSSSAAHKDNSEFASTVIEEKTIESPKEKLVEFDKQWYNGNVYTCTPCNFNSNSLVNLKVHVKKEHNTSLSRWKEKYTSSCLKYTCQFCGDQVSYEKEAIRIHVETHFLTLDSYGRMYERKRIEKLEAEKNEEKVMESIGVGATNQSEHEDDMNHGSVNSIGKGAEESRKEETRQSSKEEERTGGNEKQLSKSEATYDDLDELNKSLAKLAESVVGKKKAEVKIQDLKHRSNNCQKLNGNSSEVGKEDESEKGKETEKVLEKEESAEREKVVEKEESAEREKIERLPESQRKLSIESPTGKDGKDDVYVYLCPFPACDFSTDFEGMKYGPAASHGVEVHNTQPYEIKKNGLKWKKVSLENQLCSMFAD